MTNIQRLLDERVTAAMRAALPAEALAKAGDAPAVVMPAQDARFGDYQANGAMALAKRIGQNPRDVAEAILKRLDVSDVCETPEIAGPGFINLRFRPDYLFGALGAACADDRLGVERAKKPETVVVDYSAPNLAKEMHVGHLRSTIIGDALVRMLEFAGHAVVRQNHVGDWGTQFGMHLAYTRRFAHMPFADMLREHPELRETENIYQEAKKLFDSDPTFADEARCMVRMLQAGDKDCLDWWSFIRRLTLEHCQLIYRRLGVLLTYADVRGESDYNEVLPDIVKALADNDLLTDSQGAQCVFLKFQTGVPKPMFLAQDGTPLPLIVQKSDEGYLYATTDLAAIAFRTGCLPEIRNPPFDFAHGPEPVEGQSAIRNSNSPRAGRILYVVDARQALHFQMVFAVARAADFAPERIRLEHIAFGTMMGENGRPFRTREGGTVKLMDLLDEAERRARDLVDQKSPGLSEDERKEIARKVGIGAVKYADLAQNRTSDYVFSWEKMLSLDGNTAPYLQYAYTRIRSIFRRGGHEAETQRCDSSPIPLAAPEELALGKMLLRFPETLSRALEDYRPSVLATYLFDLAQAFTAFYNACPVIQSDEPTRSARLKLCDLAARILSKGLYLLGIDTAERM